MLTIGDVMNHKLGTKQVKRVKWLSPVGECDMCGVALTDKFVDGKTAMGPWAMMCLRCHREVGQGIGTGRGQVYQQEGGEWWKVAG